MIISLAAPRKGMGQTITAINIAGALSALQNSRSLLIDVNKHYRDAEYYLSDAGVTKGLDDFISLYGAGMLDPSVFKTCVKRSHTLDLMTANRYGELDEPIIAELLAYADKCYSCIVVDTISGSNQLSRYFMEKSDIVLVVLNQNRNAVQMLQDIEAYRCCQDRLVFVVNKYMGEKDGKRAGYGLSGIAAHLRALGFRNKVYALDFDMDILNECNYNRVMEFVSNWNAEESPYRNQLFGIADDLLLRCGCINLKEELHRTPHMERKPILSLLNRARRALHAVE